MKQPLSPLTPEQLKALPVDERLERGRLAERYRRYGSESVAAVRDLQRKIGRGAVCEICRSAVRLSIDHIHPIILGGNHEPENLRILCGSCNSRKGGRTSPPTPKPQVNR